MAGAEVNLYGVGDVDLTAMMDTLDKQRVTFHALSLTHYDDTALPAIAAGSLAEVGGTLFKFTSEEAITAWAAVAVGVAYIKLVPAGTSPDTVTAEFTDTAPTWSDAKQGWYGTAAAANHRYIATLDKVDAATYSNKNVYKGRYGERPMQIETKIKEDTATGLSAGAATDIDVTGFSFTPTAVLNVSIYAWNTANNEYDLNIADDVSFHSLFGGAPNNTYIDYSSNENAQVAIIKATPGANKVTVRIAVVTSVHKYRITCTAARGG